MSDFLWFGTEEYMGWIPAPLSGAEMSPEGWSAGGTLLSGGGYQSNSWGSHKVYTFEWPSASSLEMAQLMKSYSDGTYGRGLLYMVDPLIYDRNILPARIADPSMAIGDESASLIYGIEPVAVPTSGWQANKLPVNAAQYSMVGIVSGFRGTDEAVFIPIPEGYTLHLGAFYSYTGSGGVFVSPQTGKGNIGTLTRVAPLATASATVAGNTYSDIDGVWLWVGRSTEVTSTVTIQGIIGRLAKTGAPAPSAGPWIGGMGHSGMRFATRPSWKANNGVNGGQVGFAASFREVGSWSYA